MSICLEMSVQILHSVKPQPWNLFISPSLCNFSIQQSESLILAQREQEWSLNLTKGASTLILKLTIGNGQKFSFDAKGAKEICYLGKIKCTEVSQEESNAVHNLRYHWGAAAHSLIKEDGCFLVIPTYDLTNKGGKMTIWRNMQDNFKLR